MSSSPLRTSEPPMNVNLATVVYERVKQDIFDFRLLPGDRLTETEIALRTQASRTPVREALYRLERDGYLEVMFRAGWRVRPFDFRQFEELYDLRIVLETTAVRRLCEASERVALDALKKRWLCPPEERETDMREVARFDEAFHTTLVEAAGNREMSRVHAEVTERIRIIRRLDFTKPPRIDAAACRPGRTAAARAYRSEQGRGSQDHLAHDAGGA